MGIYKNAVSHKILKSAWGTIIDSLQIYYDVANSSSYPGSGSTINDLGNLVWGGTLANTIPYSTTDGGTLTFNGTNHYITLGGSTGFNYGAVPFSLAYWVKHTSLTSLQLNGGNPQGPIVLYKGQYKANGFYDQTNPDGSVQFMTNQTNASQTTATAPGVVAAGAWYNVCYVRNGSSVKIYVNGIDCTSSAAVHINPASGTDSFRIGAYTSTFLFRGSFSIFMAYNKALTATEVMYNFKAVKGRFGL